MSINLGRDEMFWRLGHEKTEKLLKDLNNIENVNFQDEKGLSYLHVACAAHYTDAVKILLERGANPNVTDSRGRMPVFAAIGSINDQAVSILELLLQHGLDLNFVRRNGATVREMIQSFDDNDYNCLIEKYDK